MPQYWHRMKCGNETPTSINETCCHSWCEQLTSCFSQLPPWKKDCVRMWRCRKKPRKQISIILTNTTDSSYLGRIKVKQCWAKKPNFPAIKITPSSEVRVFDFLVTFLVPVVVVTLISPFREQKPQPQSAQTSELQQKLMSWRVRFPVFPMLFVFPIYNLVIGYSILNALAQVIT